MKHQSLVSKASLVVAALGLAVGGTGVAVASHSSAPDKSQHVTERQIPNLGLVKNQIKAYYGDTGTGAASPTSDYAREAHKKEFQALRGIRHLIKQADASPVLLLDVDDTSLLTYGYEATHDFGYDPVANAAYIHDPGMPPVFGMPQLASFLADKGVSVYFLTGRPEAQRDDTLRDLQLAGYPNATSDHLFMRNKTAPPAYLPCEPTCTTVQYKSLTREHIESLGNDIILNMGDQQSDLDGGFADKTVKMPNPMYFIS